MSIMTDPTEIRRFVTAGKATITLASAATGAHYTYKVSHKEGCPDDLFFVSLLSGPDNESDYTYLGSIRGTRFNLTGKSKLPATAKPVRAMLFFCEQVLAFDKMPPALEVRHEGRCGRCNRVLTTPESIDTGFGPECREIMGV